MKFAFFTGSWPASRVQNGVVTYVDIITRALRAAGHECVVITGNLIEQNQTVTAYAADHGENNKARLLWRGLRRRLPNARRYNLNQNALAIERALSQASKNSPVDVFEIDEAFGKAFYIQQHVTAPVAIRLHGPHFLVHQGARTQADIDRIADEGRAILAARIISSTSRRVLEAVRSYYGPGRATETAIFNPVAIPPESHCWRLPACDRNLILFIGRFDLVKGADVMLDAFARLAARYKDLRLAMVGDGKGLPGANGALLSFEEYARAKLPSGIRERVAFHGRLDPARIAELRRRAFVCVSASRFECFPYAVSEGLAMGCPMAATATFGLGEFLEQGEGVLFSDIGDSEGLASNIAALIDNPSRAEALGMAGRRIAKTRLAPEIIVEQMLEFYRGAVKNYHSESARRNGSTMAAGGGEDGS